ncbi:uncharacterized protein METZ01_LOCUS116047 [marine metagenome]|uniref:Sodium/proline symporter n=1 Tax=marine metagenome TaxID=408172 RepID=A0A381XG01_9ZZZZ
MIIMSFVTCLLIFIVIGILSNFKNQHNSFDYLLAGHNVKPWLVALSAVATNNSGYMFVGMIGYTYAVGLSSMWLLFGWILGDFFASLFIHERLREITEKENAYSFVGVLSRWHGNNYQNFRLIGGIITLAFLGTYAAAQLSAGSKALHVLLGWNYSAGAIIGAIMVLLYCYSGGIRASIWTDAAQSFVMVLSMSLLVFVGVKEVGSISQLITELNLVSPTYMNFFPSDLLFGEFFGPILFIGSWMFAGFGVVGQPHIMVRFMAMDKPQNMNRVRFYYYSWYCVFSFLTISAGLLARLLLPDTDTFDTELALPALSLQLLPEILVGLILAGLFAATMSTADSQILSCSATITRDFTDDKKSSYLKIKLSTLFVTIIALIIALSGTKSVFSLVIVAWSALACAFAPIMTIYVLGGKPSERLTICMVITGIGVMLLWRYLGLNDAIYEVAPGILAGLISYWVLQEKV